jgi:hypothetical protein
MFLSMAGSAQNLQIAEGMPTAQAARDNVVTLQMFGRAAFDTAVTITAKRRRLRPLVFSAAKAGGLAFLRTKGMHTAFCFEVFSAVLAFPLHQSLLTRDMSLVIIVTHS